MTWMFTPRSGHGASSDSKSISVARRECASAGASATLTMNGSLIARTLDHRAQGGVATRSMRGGGALADRHQDRSSRASATLDVGVHHVRLRLGLGEVLLAEL